MSWHIARPADTLIVLAPRWQWTRTIHLGRGATTLCGQQAVSQVSDELAAQYAGRTRECGSCTRIVAPQGSAPVALQLGAADGTLREEA